VIVGAPSAAASAEDGSSSLAISVARTRLPVAAKNRAIAAATVVLPTPPFPVTRIARRWSSAFTSPAYQDRKAGC